MNKVHIDKIRLLDGKFNSIQIGDLSDVKIKNKEIIGFDSDIRHSNRMNIENKLMKIIFDIIDYFENFWRKKKFDDKLEPLGL